MIALDSIDLSILENIQKNGRITNVELASITGISAPPCLRRLKSLEKNGIITGYHADIDPEYMGYGFKGMSVITLSSQNIKDVTTFINNISKLKNVRSCFSTPGEQEFVLTIIAQNLQEYDRFLENYIQSDRNVVGIKTYIYMKGHKNEFGIPL